MLWAVKEGGEHLVWESAWGTGAGRAGKADQDNSHFSPHFPPHRKATKPQKLQRKEGGGGEAKQAHQKGVEQDDLKGPFQLRQF